MALVTALRSLPERQRRALVLHYLADLPVAELVVETADGVETRRYAYRDVTWQRLS